MRASERKVVVINKEICNKIIETSGSRARLPKDGSSTSKKGKSESQVIVHSKKEPFIYVVGRKPM